MQIQIEKMVYGGAGLARTDQGIIFVPRAAPGDVLEVEDIGIAELPEQHRLHG